MTTSRLATTIALLSLAACGGTADGGNALPEVPTIAENHRENPGKTMEHEDAAAPSSACAAPLTGACVRAAGALCTEHRSSGAGRVECEAIGGTWTDGAACPLEPGGCVVPAAGGGCTVDVWRGEDTRAGCEADGYRWVTP